MSRREEYVAYLETPTWKKLSAERLKTDNHQCLLCGELAQVVHHRRYPAVFGTEDVKNDLSSLCHDCHRKIHKPPCLDEVIKEFQAKAVKGVTCPCCDRYYKIYQRKLNSGMARILIAMYRQGGTWLRVSENFGLTGLSTQNLEYSKLRYWGLVEQRTKTNGKLAPGEWRVTDKGSSFVRKEIAVPKIAIVEDGTLLHLNGPDIFIDEALGDNFSYYELLNT